MPYATIGVLIGRCGRCSCRRCSTSRGVGGVLAGSSNLEHLLQHVPAVKLPSYADHDRLVSAYLAGEFEIMSATRRAGEVNAGPAAAPLVEQFRQTGV